MNFNDLPAEQQNKITQTLDTHLANCTANLAKDKCVIPMLMTQSDDPNFNLLIGLQSESGQTDVDAAFKAAIQQLKSINFNTAVFSYSTKISSGDGKYSDALKTCIIDKSGLTAVFFTPFVLSGIFKKKVKYEQSYIAEIIENALA